MHPFTKRAISTMLSKPKGTQNFVVQASKIKLIQDCMRIDIYDGDQDCKALIQLNPSKPSLDLRKVGKPYGEDSKYLLQINQYSTFQQNGKLYIEILAFTPLEPVSKTSSKNGNSQIKKEVKFQNGQRNATSKKQSERYKAISPIKFEGSTQKLKESNSQAMDVQDQFIQSDELKNFDKITDLFVDISNWEIVVRVLEKSYRQFHNKSGKLTKIFSMLLVDRTGTKIQGVMFGQSAKEYHDLITADRIYRMSRGQIRQENYNLNRGEKFSKYNIIFTKNSIFIPIRDIPAIPYAVDSSVSFNEFLKPSNMDKQLDTVGILLSIGEERTFEKEDRSIFKKSLTIGDPYEMKSIEVVLWSKDLIVQNEWIQRTVQFRNFKLNTYRDTISLNSLFKSQVKLLNRHRFTEYEGRYSEAEFKNISESNVPGPVNTKQKSVKTIKELQLQISVMNASESIYSDLQVWFTHASFKGRWFYEACNNQKCKRGTQSFSKCLHCGHFNDNTQRKLILPIEISDITGSLWTTAFDQFAQQIFKGLPIEQLYTLEQTPLKEEAEKRMYQQFKLRLQTKKQMEGNIKHSIIGKPNELSVEKATSGNVERIRKILFD